MFSQSYYFLTHFHLRHIVTAHSLQSQYPSIRDPENTFDNNMSLIILHVLGSLWLGLLRFWWLYNHLFHRPPSVIMPVAFLWFGFKCTSDAHYECSLWRSFDAKLVDVKFLWFSVQTALPSSTMIRIIRRNQKWGQIKKWERLRRKSVSRSRI